jgi:hypothetical protein
MKSKKIVVKERSLPFDVREDIGATHGARSYPVRGAGQLRRSTQR